MPALMCHTMPFSTQALKNNMFFDVDIGQKKSKCGLAWSVLLLTTIHIISGQNLLWTHSAAPCESTTRADKSTDHAKPHSIC